MSVFDQKYMRRRVNAWGWILMLPTAAAIIISIIYPVVFSTIMSFTNWRFQFVNVKFIGLQNYEFIFSELGQAFFKSIGTSLFFAFVSTTIQTVLGFLLAYVLYNLSKRLQALYRVLVYIPVILPSSVVALMWIFIYRYETGLIDTILRTFNLWTGIEWITDPKFAMGSVIFTNTWQHIGITTIIYFVAMNAVGTEIVESARIDGAGRGRILVNMILPLTWGSTVVNFLLSIMGGIKSFDLFYLFSNGSGEYGLNVVGLYIYNVAFSENLFCRAVAMSLVLSIIICIITVGSNALLKLGGERE